MEANDMDKLAEQLKSDAESLDVRISDELDRRISASLEATRPERPVSTVVRQRTAAFWWASSLTGAAAALLVITIINKQVISPVAPLETPDTSPIAFVKTPMINWKAESAMLTSPLEQELLDLQSDLKKAEQKVKQDIGL
jgi:hypothetical protein